MIRRGDAFTATPGMGLGRRFEKESLTMKSLFVLATATAFALGLSGPVVADEATFKSAGCAKCHDPDKKKKGAPSVKDMQGKFKGDKSKIDSLASVVVKGKDHPEVDAKEPDVKKAMAFAIGAK